MQGAYSLSKNPIINILKIYLKKLCPNKNIRWIINIVEKKKKRRIIDICKYFITQQITLIKSQLNIYYISHLC